eukprot:7391509-Prymnesium_polylepis.2
MATFTAAPDDSPTVMWRAAHRGSTSVRTTFHSYSMSAPKMHVTLPSARQSDAIRKYSVGSAPTFDCGVGASQKPVVKTAAGRERTSVPLAASSRTELA